MEKYIGIGFVILCLAVLAGIVGILGYQFHLSKEKVDISPANANINQSNKITTEWGESLTLFYYININTFFCQELLLFISVTFLLQDCNISIVLCQYFY